MANTSEEKSTEKGFPITEITTLNFTTLATEIKTYLDDYSIATLGSSPGNTIPVNNFGVHWDTKIAEAGPGAEITVNLIPESNDSHYDPLIFAWRFKERGKHPVKLAMGEEDWRRIFVLDEAAGAYSFEDDIMTIIPSVQKKTQTIRINPKPDRDYFLSYSIVFLLTDLSPYYFSIDPLIKISSTRDQD